MLSHARALLTSSPEGACDYIEADLREPDKVLSGAARTLDFTQPVALLLLGVLHHISGTDQAQEIVRRLVAPLVPGSFLAVNHSTSAVSGAAMEEAVAHWNQVGTPLMTLRSPEQIARFFDGLDLLEPGVVPCSRWRPASARWAASHPRSTNSAASPASRNRPHSRPGPPGPRRRDGRPSLPMAGYPGLLPDNYDRNTATWPSTAHQRSGLGAASPRRGRKSPRTRFVSFLRPAAGQNAPVRARRAFPTRPTYSKRPSSCRAGCAKTRPAPR